MKKLLVYLSLFFVILFSGFSFVEAKPFDEYSDKKNPYDLNCGPKWCLQKWVDEARDKVTDVYNDKNKWASDYLQDIIAYPLSFLYFIAVVIIIYSGAMILTANWDEEKVSKAKKIILYVIIGMIVIFLAGEITNFVLDMFKEWNKS